MHSQTFLYKIHEYNTCWIFIDIKMKNWKVLFVLLMSIWGIHVENSSDLCRKDIYLAVNAK